MNWEWKMEDQIFKLRIVENFNFDLSAVEIPNQARNM
jgi:hypothetical protein